MCIKGFKTPLSVTLHLKSHTSENPHKLRKACQVCVKGFLTNQDLEAHINDARTVNTQHTCRERRPIYNTSSQLTKHCHNQMAGNICVTSEGELFNPSSVIDTIKELHVKDSRPPAHQDIHNHTHESNGHKGNEQNIIEWPHTCLVCGKGYIHFRNLEKHLTVAHSNNLYVKCFFCVHGFISPVELEDHVSIIHA